MMGASFDDLRHIHFSEADMHADGASHKEVVMATGDSAVSAVSLTFILEILGQATLITFGI